MDRTEGLGGAVPRRLGVGHAVGVAQEDERACAPGAHGLDGRLPDPCALQALAAPGRIPGLGRRVQGTASLPLAAAEDDQRGLLVLGAQTGEHLLRVCRIRGMRLEAHRLGVREVLQGWGDGAVVTRAEEDDHGLAGNGV